MFTMRPALRSMKCDVIALHVRKTDLVLTAKVRSQSSSVLFVNGMPGGPAAPALLTRMSILPNDSRVRSTIVLTSAALVTSVFMATTLRPSPLTSPATFSALSTWMSGIAISAPSRASASTMPRPIPLPPPVTTATLPASRMETPSIYNRCPGGPMTAHQLRSRNWFGRNDLDGFVHRSWLKAEGFSDALFDGRPVVGIANSWSELTNCNAHLRQVADAAVLLSGCDKTTPAMLMGAASADIPAVMVTGGPMLSGKWRAEELGSGTDAWRLWAERRAGRLTDEELCEAESCMSRSSGHCMVMGTASTMASMAEALGMTLSGNAAIPASDSRRLAMAEMAGRRAVEMALAGGPKPSQILTAQA